MRYPATPCTVFARAAPPEDSAYFAPNIIDLPIVRRHPALARRSLRDVRCNGVEGTAAFIGTQDVTGPTCLGKHEPGWRH